MVSRLLPPAIALVAVAAAAAAAPPTPPATTTTTAAPPPALACLGRYYAVTPALEAGRWMARLDDGTRIAWDDGRTKSAEERLDAPDVKDVFAQPYPRGPIRPVVTVDEDPGRVRLDAVLRATYPARGLGRVTFFGHALTMHAKVAPALERVAARLERAFAAQPDLRRFVARLGGAYNPRVIAGTNRPSAHGWGIALDLNDRLSDYWRWQRPPEPLRWRNRLPQAIVDAFEAEGFIWGGRWYHYDTMHFEYRPELVDPACLAR